MNRWLTSMPSAARHLTLALVFSASLTACSAPSAQLPDVNATVEAAVSTAIARERAKPTETAANEVKPTVTPAVGREQWLKAGREFFSVEIDIREAADSLRDLYFSTTMPGGTAPNKPSWDKILYVQDKRPKVRDRLMLVPLPDDTVGRSIRVDVLQAFDSLGEFQNGVFDLLLSAGKTPTPPSTANASGAAASEAWRKNRAFEDSWQRGRDRLFATLSQHGISMSDLELDKLPRATPTPAPTPTPPKPPTSSLELTADDPTRLPNGTWHLSGHVKNSDKYWSATELTVIIRIKGVTGKQDREEVAKAGSSTLRPGDRTFWNYTMAAADEPWYVGPSTRWYWEPPTRGS